MEWIVAIVLVLLVFGVAWALYTRRGTTIEQHPRQDDGPPRADPEVGSSGARREDQPEPELDRRGTGV